MRRESAREPAADPQWQTETIPVGGMVCESCEGMIQHTLENEPAVRSAQASHAEKQVVVTFDAARLSAADLVALINEKTQYRAAMPGEAPPEVENAMAPMPAPVSAEPAPHENSAQAAGADSR